MTLLLVNIHWAGEVSAQCFLPCPPGRTIPEAGELFQEQWAECVQALQAADPDDDWTIDDVVGRMGLLGWPMDSFGASLDVDV